jgi:FMN phosphatase YigB (HAD superfamily)
VKTIVWDVDDVLNELMRTWFERWWVPSHPGCPIRYDEISENPPHELLGISESEYLASLDEFRLSDIARQMTPVPEVLAWFRQYGDRFRHVALTATPLHTAPASAAWVMCHFGRWIRSFHVIPSPRQGEQIPIYDKSKEDFLHWWGKGDVFVDDSPLNVTAAKALGIQAVLIPRPWNQRQMTLTEALDVLTGLAQ